MRKRQFSSSRFQSKKISGVNGMTTAKTALHTSNECDMYAHVSPYDMTGDWEWISEYCCV